MNSLARVIKNIAIFAAFFAIIAFIFLGYRVRENVKQVVTYEKNVVEAVKINNIDEYENLVLAIIYTESKGKAIDLMQSSESEYGEQHMIDDPKESITIGVAFFAEAIEKADEEGCDIWTAVQAYNFGLDYIDFVKENGGENSIRLAEKYSKEVLSPLLGNNNERKYRYYRPQSLLYNGGFLYKNGGNMFYADIVKMNEKFIRIFK